MTEATKKPLRGRKPNRPTKAEMEQKYDMPGMSEDEVRKAFFNPVAPGRPKADRE